MELVDVYITLGLFFAAIVGYGVGRLAERRDNEAILRCAYDALEDAAHTVGDMNTSVLEEIQRARGWR